MKASEIRALSDDELLEKLTSLKRELSKEKATVASKTRSEKPSKIKNLRRDIARILTVINERKIAIAGKSLEENANKKEVEK
ncbi:MAG: 50S ribosomal protein L29 [Candidatus Diapherotrites archaeon]|nr:50S ribosomal protein L29 [Candidatus Diapherotrites archaeon]